jgi:hypothetical protein
VLFGSAVAATRPEERHPRSRPGDQGPHWRHLSERGIPGVGTVSGDPVTHFWDGRIQFSQGWISPAGTQTS